MNFGTITIHNEGSTEEPSWVVTGNLEYLHDCTSLEEAVAYLKDLEKGDHIWTRVVLDIT